jgi:hypothetical protein
MDDKVTKTQDHHALVSAFMFSGVFSFVVAALFMLSSISGHGMDQPFGMLTSILCR